MLIVEWVFFDLFGFLFKFWFYFVFLEVEKFLVMIMVWIGLFVIFLVGVFVGFVVK